ncbi:MAG: hypothetical protein AABZ74_04350, partial [Cyanobacteriota bacterium]
MINNSKISEKVTEEVIFLEGLDASFDVNHLLENLYCLRTIIQKDFDISCLNFVSNLYLYIGVTNNKEFENSLNKILAPVFNQIVHDFSNDIIITSFINGFQKDIHIFINSIKSILNKYITKILIATYSINTIDDFIECFYPAKVDDLYEKEKDSFANPYKNIVKSFEIINSLDLGYFNTEILKIMKNDFGIEEEKILNIIKYILSMVAYKEESNISEIYCLVASNSENSNNKVLIASLELHEIPNNLVVSDKIFVSSDNLIILENHNKIKESLKESIKCINITRSDLNLDNYLYHVNFRLTHVEIVEEQNTKKFDKISISGPSFNFPITLILFSTKIGKVPVTLNMSICATGDIEISNNKISIKSISYEEKKIDAIKKYNESKTRISEIKYLYIPEENETAFEKIMREQELNINLKPVKDFWQVDFIDPFIEYVDSIKSNKIIENNIESIGLEKLIDINDP